jgi:glutathione peroxidase-family protein
MQAVLHSLTPRFPITCLLLLAMATLQGMVALESKFAGKPFAILAFPCNEVSAQSVS